MTIEEKLKHFLDTCMEDTNTRSKKMLEEYEAELEKTFKAHQADVKRREAMWLRQESEKLERETNKKLAIEQLGIRRIQGQKQEELMDQLFVEVKDQLANFLETNEYQKLLEEQVRKAVEFAGEDKVIVYLDPVDEDKLARLELHHGDVEFRLSEYSFTGGSRAVIPSRHILIDNSFQTKLTEARENFHFDLTLTEGGRTHG